MYQRLKQKLRKQNDINEYERQKKIKLSTEQFSQGINYTQAKFFSNCQNFFNNVIQDSRNQQKIIEHKRKIKKLKELQSQKSCKTSEVDKMLIFNIIVDYFRSYNMNYSYSVIMREKNVISDQIVLKNDLINALSLQNQYKKDQRFNVSVLQLIMNKMRQYENLLIQKNYQNKQIGIQCDILTNYNQVNSILLTELKLQSIRKQTQEKQKKHYQNMVHLFKSQQLIKIKQDMLKMYEVKQKNIVKKYEQKFNQLIKNHSQSQKYQSQTKKQEEYLTEIQSLKKQIRKLKQMNYSLEKDKLSHNCLENKSVKDKLQSIAQQRKLINEKKKQFQLALLNMDTKIQDLYQQKVKIMSDSHKPTQQYILKMRQHKQNKDYMIQKVYGTLKHFQKRIEDLSKDNVKLLQENQVLRAQVVGFKKEIKQISSFSQTNKKKINISEIKCQTKNISLSVTPEQILNQVIRDQKTLILKQKTQEQDEQSILTFTSQQFEERMKQKAIQAQKINRLKYEMGMLKSKVKYLVMDFE